jgi:hypothetical protein
MKQAVELSRKELDQIYMELAPTDIECLPVLMPKPEQKPVPAPEQRQERAPTGTLAREQLDLKIRQEYFAEIDRQRANNVQVSRAAGTLAMVKLSAVGAGCTLAYQIATAFNPVAFAVTFGAVGIIAMLTYPRKAKAEQPTWMPRNSEQKTQIANVNVSPEIIVTVNMNQ